MLILEEDGKQNGNCESKAGKHKPAGGPIAQQIITLPRAIVIDYLTCCQCSDCSADAIGHHHKQTLCRSLDAGFTFLIDKDAARDVEEVEGNAIDDTGQDEEQHTRHGRIA